MIAQFILTIESQTIDLEDDDEELWTSIITRWPMYILYNNKPFLLVKYMSIRNQLRLWNDIGWIYFFLYIRDWSPNTTKPPNNSNKD